MLRKHTAELDHPRAMRWLIMAAMWCGGCWWEPSCDPPDTVEFECQPIPAGSPGCVGGPTYPEYGHYLTIDADKTFPFGCNVHLPQCDPNYFVVEVAICVQQDATTGEWVIPR